MLFQQEKFDGWRARWVYDSMAPGRVLRFLGRGTQGRLREMAKCLCAGSCGALMGVDILLTKPAMPLANPMRIKER